METVTISPRFQIVIPGQVRRLLGVQPGQKVRVILSALSSSVALTGHGAQLGGQE